MIEPPFTILPREEFGLFAGCPGVPATKTVEVEVRDIPFDYAIPVLTGWELQYNCEDQHVKLVGIRLEDVEYVKDPAETTGSLRYKVVSELRDDNNHPGHFSRHKVTILGLNGHEPSDLVPKLDEPGPCVTVAVANIGGDDAPASITRLEFNGVEEPVDIETPELPKGFKFKFDPFDVPTECGPGVNCSFSVIVDADMEVVETDELNNTASGVCIG